LNSKGNHETSFRITSFWTDISTLDLQNKKQGLKKMQQECATPITPYTLHIPNVIPPIKNQRKRDEVSVPT
jgi:hypothetical protein